MFQTIDAELLQTTHTILVTWEPNLKTMPTKKSTATTTEAVKPAGKPAPAKKTTAPKSAPEVKAKATPTAAATHKAPARKSAAPKAAVKPAATPKPAFDENAYRAEIEHEAYLLWESRGHAHGEAHQDWLRAVEVVRARYAK
jgi:Protein of unknown function (DUF2934)